jgi:hypothetical protein
MESQKLLPLILNYKVLNINFNFININYTVNNINFNILNIIYTAIIINFNINNVINIVNSINFTVISINNTVNNINYIPQFDLCTVFKSIEPTILRYVDFPARSLLVL